MKLNLGCGPDYKQGYVNVDVRQPCDEIRDLSVIPWNWWSDSSVEEILMLDFLEHFPYGMTQRILEESNRILVEKGTLIVQVPDFDHCARAVLQTDMLPFQCNACGEWIVDGEYSACTKCGQSSDSIQDAAIHRLYGGQDYPGNWHYNAFTRDTLRRHLHRAGFYDIMELERDHQYANWNFKLQARKFGDFWKGIK